MEDHPQDGGAVIFISHPEVIVDPARPVTRWQLSDTGIARMRDFAERIAPTAIWASAETKAIEAAGILAAAHGMPVHVDHALHENDRSATGFLPPAEFEAMADAFFANPNERVRGWESAAAAQARIVAAWDRIRAQGDAAIVAHGAVGTLLLCHLRGLPISREYDQPSQGHFWRLDQLDLGWQRI